MWPKIEDQASAYRLAGSGAIRDTAIDYTDVAVVVAAELARRYPDELIARYKLKSLPAYSANPDAERVESDGPRKVDLMALSGFNGVAILEEIASKRGGLRAGGIIDLHRGAEVLLHELRDGKLGRLTLETPADIPAEPVPEASGETEDGARMSEPSESASE
jgi:ribosome biogenesis GTPase A